MKEELPAGEHEGSANLSHSGATISVQTSPRVGPSVAPPHPSSKRKEADDSKLASVTVVLQELVDAPCGSQSASAVAKEHGSDLRSESVTGG